jgi:hypothetical protein
MQKNIKWANKELPGLTHEDLLQITISNLSKKENGLLAATQVNFNQGKKNAQSGHMKSIQPLGCSIGGKIGGTITRDSGKLKENGKLGNESNQQKYGVRIIATNLLSEECWEYISIREAERDLKIQAPIIRKILRGLQPKTRCGWTFEYK